MRRFTHLMCGLFLLLGACAGGGSASKKGPKGSAAAGAADASSIPPGLCLSTIRDYPPLQVDDYQPDGDNFEQRLCSLIGAHEKAKRDGESPGTVYSQLESRKVPPAWLKKGSWKAEGEKFTVWYGVGVAQNMSPAMQSRVASGRAAAAIGKLHQVSVERSADGKSVKTVTKSAATVHGVQPVDWYRGEDGSYYTLVGERRHRPLWDDLCQAKDTFACRTSAEFFYYGVGVEKSLERTWSTLRIGCDEEHAGCCNQLAWWRCHDQKECDERALADAMAAAKIEPDDGAVLDTLAFVKCARGDDAGGKEAYQRSCAAGVKQNCDRVCGPHVVPAP